MLSKIGNNTRVCIFASFIQYLTENPSKERKRGEGMREGGEREKKGGRKRRREKGKKVGRDSTQKILGNLQIIN